MKILINGQLSELHSKTLAELLHHLEHEPDTVATAVNGSFVPKSERENIKLNDNDEIEIIAPIAGG